MAKRSTVLYAAKQAWRLNLMRGINSSTICKLDCKVHYVDGVGYVNVAGTEVKVAKCWSQLI